MLGLLIIIIITIIIIIIHNTNDKSLTFHKVGLLTRCTSFNESLLLLYMVPVNEPWITLFNNSYNDDRNNNTCSPWLHSLKESLIYPPPVTYLSIHSTGKPWTSNDEKQINKII